jgi:methionyl-tRNA formyltransferase
VRALAPTPGAWTALDGDRLRILAARAEPGEAGDAPGTVRRSGSSELRVAAGSGWVVPRVVQRAGGRAVPIAAFLRGRDVPDGTRLGDPT